MLKNNNFLGISNFCQLFANFPCKIKKFELSFVTVDSAEKGFYFQGRH